MFRDDAEYPSANRLKSIFTNKENGKPCWYLTDSQKDEYEDWQDEVFLVTSLYDKS
jgi:hypothetical protein